MLRMGKLSRKSVCVHPSLDARCISGRLSGLYENVRTEIHGYFAA